MNMLTSMSYQPILVYNPQNEQSKLLVEKIKNKLISISESIKVHESLNSNKNNNFVIFYIFNREAD